MTQVLTERGSGPMSRIGTMPTVYHTPVDVPFRYAVVRGAEVIPSPDIPVALNHPKRKRYIVDVKQDSNGVTSCSSLFSSYIAYI